MGEPIENPYLAGRHAPVPEEMVVHDLEVEGEIPKDLFGAYVRNGPNPMFPPSNLYHWFDGDGMVHGVYFRHGAASYRNRWVRTAGLMAETAAGRSLWPGIMGPFDVSRNDGFLKDTANTDLVWHDGRLLALWYLCGEPYALDPSTLETLGVAELRGKKAPKIAAHPKRDERTGELVWFTLSDFDPPYMTYGVASEDGRVIHEVPIDLPGPRAPHDVTITERYSVLHDFPFFHDADLLRSKGHRVARFHRDLPSRFGVLPRHGGNDDIRWFEFEPGYVLHMVNAWEDGDWIVMDGCFQPDPSIRRNPDEGALASMLGYLRVRTHLRRWKMNLRTGEAREEQLDDRNVEFCLPDTALYGECTRYSYHQEVPPNARTVGFPSLVKYDHATGHATVRTYGDGWYGSETPFASRAGGVEEDDGYLPVLVTNEESLQSECWVLSAREPERPPLARVKLPRRVPSGFHAKWIPGERVWPRG